MVLCVVSNKSTKSWEKLLLSKNALKDKIWILQNATSQEVKTLSEHGKMKYYRQNWSIGKGDFHSLST